ncbi:hypothetical protein WJX73_002057 [Symbiochloris irregularis]|uniref:Peptidase S54 rhomboid domain-containing protein n=1 Tax=Symbiochloris irregularis TaxID=706552 RepID=A0AAW1NYZ1_9CHLO
MDERDIFGSDSDDDDGFAPPAKPAQEEAAGGLTEQDNDREDQAEEDAWQAEEAGDEDRAAGDEDELQFQESQEERAPPIELEAPLIQGPDPSTLRFMRTSNILGINTRPFTPRAFARSENVWEDEQGRQHVDLRHLNTIRWRWSVQPDGSKQPQSNARLVRWEDGSVQLLVGTEVLNVSETDITSNHQHLYVRHDVIQQGQAPLNQRMTFQPASLKAGFHKRLAANAERKHAKQTRVQQVTVMKDPVQERLRQEKEEEQRLRDKEALERKQARTMRSYAYPREPANRNAMTAGFLEAGDNDDGDLDEEGEEDAEQYTRGQILDEIEERRREQRLAQAKRDPVGVQHRRTPPPKRRQDDDLDGFIVDEEDEEENVRDRKSKHQRRAVVLSDTGCQVQAERQERANVKLPVAAAKSAFLSPGFRTGSQPWQARSLTFCNVRASRAQCRHRSVTRSLRPLAAAQSDSSWPTGSIPSTSLQGSATSAAPRPAAFEHLSGNMFMLYVFGRIVEEEEGIAGVWGTYLTCALGASIATLFLSASNTVSLGASGAVFGMFTMAVLTKLRFNFKKLLECAILGQFVVKQVIQEVQAQASKGVGLGAQQIAGVQVGHIAHIAGALAGVLLVLLLSRIPDPTGASA